MIVVSYVGVFFFQAEDGIRDLVRSRGLGDVYKRQIVVYADYDADGVTSGAIMWEAVHAIGGKIMPYIPCLLYTSDAADERSSVDLGGRRIIKQKRPWN